jgi:hypothetical protein
MVALKMFCDRKTASRECWSHLLSFCRVRTAFILSAGFYCVPWAAIREALLRDFTLLRAFTLLGSFTLLGNFHFVGGFHFSRRFTLFAHFHFGGAPSQCGQKRSILLEANGRKRWTTTSWRESSCRWLLRHGYLSDFGGDNVRFPVASARSEHRRAAELHRRDWHGYTRYRRRGNSGGMRASGFMWSPRSLG